MAEIEEDVWLFLEQCDLNEKRLVAVRRNLPAAFADACLCAEMIYSYFPKMIDRSMLS